MYFCLLVKRAINLICIAGSDTWTCIRCSLFRRTFVLHLGCCYLLLLIPKFSLEERCRNCKEAELHHPPPPFHTSTVLACLFSMHFEPPVTHTLAVWTPQQHQGLLTPTLLLALASVLPLYQMNFSSDSHLPIAVMLHCETTRLGRQLLDRLGNSLPSPLPRPSGTAAGERRLSPPPCSRRLTPSSLLPG